MLPTNPVHTAVAGSLGDMFSPSVSGMSSDGGAGSVCEATGRVVSAAGGVIGLAQ